MALSHARSSSLSSGARGLSASATGRAEIMGFRRRMFNVSELPQEKVNEGPPLRAHGTGHRPAAWRVGDDVLHGGNSDVRFAFPLGAIHGQCPSLKRA